METIDIYDANMKLIGNGERKEVHKLGLWHRTFHCWFVSDYDCGSILFQLRAKDKLSYPDMFDISAAGHLLSGEDTLDGIREISEELGINIKESELFNLGYRVEVADEDNLKKNREYQAVFLYKCNIPLNQYNPQKEEVAGLYWMPIKDGIKLFDKKLASTKISGIVLNSNGNFIKSNREVSLIDFIPRVQNYYLTVCIMAERLLEGRFPISIS